MNRYRVHRKKKKGLSHFVWLWILFLFFLAKPLSDFVQSAYFVYVSVQMTPSYGIYLTDYYSGSCDLLIATLLNCDKLQRPLQFKLRVQGKNSSTFRLSSREELLSVLC